MKKIKQIFGVTLGLILVSLFAAAGFTNQAQAAAASIYISPASSSAVNGSNFSVSVRANTGGSNADAANVTLSYDSSKLQFVSASAAASPLSLGANYADTGSSIAGGAYNTAPATGDILLFTATFKAKIGAGTSPLSLLTSGAYATELDSGGSSLGASLVGGSISFSEPPAPTCPTGYTGTYPNCVAPTTGGGSTGGNTGGNGGGHSTGTGNNGNGGGGGKPSTSTTTTTAPTTTTTTTMDTTTTTDSELLSSVTFKVYDKNHVPLVNKKITLHSTPQTATSDDKGSVTFKNVVPGAHSIIYNQSGKDYAQSLQLTTADAVTTATPTTVVFAVAQSSGMPAAVYGLILALLLVVVVMAVVLYRRRGSGGGGPTLMPIAATSGVVTGSGGPSVPVAHHAAPGSVVSPQSHMSSTDSSSNNSTGFGQ
jgi:hypothetical protein